MVGQTSGEGNGASRQEEGMMEPVGCGDAKGEGRVGWQGRLLGGVEQ
jgi:hypothetical protein